MTSASSSIGRYGVTARGTSPPLGGLLALVLVAQDLVPPPPRCQADTRGFVHSGRCTKNYSFGQRPKHWFWREGAAPARAGLGTAEAGHRYASGGVRAPPVEPNCVRNGAMAAEKKWVQDRGPWGPGCEPDSTSIGMKARDDLARATADFDTLRGVDGGDRRDGEAVGRLGGHTMLLIIVRIA